MNLSNIIMLFNSIVSGNTTIPGWSSFPSLFSAAIDFLHQSRKPLLPLTEPPTRLQPRCHLEHWLLESLLEAHFSFCYVKWEMLWLHKCLTDPLPFRADHFLYAASWNKHRNDLPFRRALFISHVSKKDGNRGINITNSLVSWSLRLFLSLDRPHLWKVRVRRPPRRPILMNKTAI